MQIQVNTDRHIEGSAKRTDEVETIVQQALARYGDRITRVEVFLSDENSSQKFGDSDKRCVIEARLGGLRPVTVSHQGSSLDQAVGGAADKLEKTLKRTQGRSWRELEALQQIPSRPSWSFPPRPWTSHVRSIAPSPHNSTLLLVGIELGGIMRSEDGGETWSDHPVGAQKDVHALTWHPTAAGRVYEAGGGGAAWSRDGGRSWQPADIGRNRHYTWGLAVDPNDPDGWYVSANPGARLAHYGAESAEACIYRWRGTGPWQQLGGGLPQPLNSFPYALVMNSDSLFAGLGDGRIYRSADRGDHWTQLNVHGERPECVLALIVIP